MQFKRSDTVFWTEWLLRITYVINGHRESQNFERNAENLPSNLRNDLHIQAPQRSS